MFPVPTLDISEDQTLHPLLGFVGIAYMSTLTHTQAHKINEINKSQQKKIKTSSIPPQWCG